VLPAPYLDDNPILLARLPELSGGKVLLCWCHLLLCHGDVLAKRIVLPNLGPPAFSTLSMLADKFAFLEDSLSLATTAPV
jgi:uncharacterized protein DUF4326